MSKENKIGKLAKASSPGRFFYVFFVAGCLVLLALASNQLFNSTQAQADSNKNSQGKVAKNEPQVLTSADGLPEEAQRQIAALLAEKNSRTPEQRKMDSSLIRAIKEYHHEAFAPGVDNMRPVNIDMDASDNVVLDLKVTTTDDVFQQQLASVGADIMLDMSEYNTIKVRVHMDKVEALANFPEVLFIQPEMKAELEQSPRGFANTATSSLGSNTPSLSANFVGPVVNSPETNFMVRSSNVRKNLPTLINSVAQKHRIQPATGTVNSQGDTTHRAITARTLFNMAGAGVKIGVLSDSFNRRNGVPTDITTGNLPGVGNPNGNLTPVTVLQEGPTTGIDEGRAMLQIVHDIAPQSQLFFATAFNGVASFAANIQSLRTAGCDIIIDDVFYFNESPFQDGPIAQAVNTVTASGALYFSSAGNAGNVKNATAGVWEGDFTDGGALPNLTGGTVNNFTPTGAPTLADPVPITAGSFYTLFWSDPLGASNNDYDIFIFNSTLTTIFDSGTSFQNGTQDPFEITAGGAFAGDRVVIFKSTSAAKRALHLNTNRGQLTIATGGQTKGHNSAVSAFSVAATPAGPATFGTGVIGPFPNPFNSTNRLETFSSDGPRRVFYNANGTPVIPGNLLFSTAGGTVRNKPDISAADGVSTTLAANSGLNPFFGTSAAAPHAGAIAALVKSANPNLTPAQIRSVLTLSAIDIEGNGYDNNAGFGILDTVNALQAIQGQAVISFGGFTATESIPTNNNGFIESGERAKIVTTLNNPSLTSATTVQATLSLTPPVTGVSIIAPTINFGTIAGGTSAKNSSPFIIALDPSVPCGANLAFTLTVSFGGGTSPVTFPFNIQTGKPVVITNSVTTILDATAPPASTAYTATTNTQTGRLTRNGLTSSCATPKAFPGLQDATLVRRYDAYVFTNTTGATQCFTAKLTQPSTNLFFLAYNNTGFVRTSVGTNYLADAGSSATSSTFTFNVPAGQKYTIVVHEVNTNGGLNTTYTLALSVNQTACDVVTPFSLEHNSVFATDTANNRIQRTDNDGTTWSTVGFGPGTAAGTFNQPRGISASNDNKSVFVADTGNNRIQRSTDGGTSWQVLATGGTTASTVNQPAGLVYDELLDKLYIADTGNNRILVVTAAGTANPVFSIFASSTAGTAVGQFNQPRGVAVDITGNVYVADTNNNRIQFNNTGTAGGWAVFSGATAGTAIGKVNQPRGIYVDSTGNVYVADTNNNRIQVNNTGNWSVFMAPGTASGTVNAPQGLSVAFSGNAFIGDTGNNRMQKKSVTSGTTTIVGPPGFSVGQFNQPSGVR